MLMVGGQLMPSNILVLIPCRLNSRRLPGKALKMIGGIPIIHHVYKNTKIALENASLKADLAVCTDIWNDKNILNELAKFKWILEPFKSYESYYESSWFAGLAFIYKSSTVEINDIYEIYTTSQFWSPFPRSPMVMDMNFMARTNFVQCLLLGLL